ncbi:Calmodulin-binding domain, plant [Dillenia turbinata]|uniref:Calmodulin-binding domain, plant n=1 Tax=Dillenia turbinata TaxID=194707 RepID=A0AAN8VEB1_9MAGN
MATSTTGARKGTSPSNSHVVDTAQRRTAPILKNTSTTTSEKKVPHYLRPTISSGPNSLKYVKKEDATNKQSSLNRRKSFDNKPPSPSHSRKPSPTQTGKLVPSQTLSRNKISKPSPPISSKTTPPTRPTSERTSKPGGKSQPLGTKTRYVRKSTLPSKETITSPNILHEENKEVLVHDEKDVKDDVQKEVETETAKPEKEEQVESPPAPIEEIKDVEEVPEEQPEVKEEEKNETQPEVQNSTNEPEPESEPEPEVEQKQETIPMEICENAEKEKTEEEKKEESSEGDQKAAAEAAPAPATEQITKPTETNQTTAVAKRARGKKDSPAYNVVIEETARKLVEKRKSKVLALAGAFETVISLQEPETTPSPTQAAQ